MTAKEILAALDEGRESRPTYFGPSDEPLSWNTSGKLVRLDVAIMALHLLSARVAFKSFGSIIGGQVQKFLLIPQLKKFQAREISSIAGVLGLTRRVAGLFRIVVEIGESLVAEAARERSIRALSLEIQRDLYLSNAMRTKTHRKRRMKRVFSRHK